MKIMMVHVPLSWCIISLSYFKNGGVVAWIPSSSRPAYHPFRQDGALKRNLFSDSCREKEEPLPTFKPSKGRAGRYLPQNVKDLEPFLTVITEYALAAKKAGDPLIKPIEDLKRIVLQDKVLAENAEQMFIDANNFKEETPLNTPEMKNFEQFLHTLNQIIRTSPAFYTNSSAPNATDANGLIAFPINAILDFPMGSDSGYVVFSNSLVNQQFKKILDYWTIFLESEESTYVFEADENDPRNVLNATLIPWFSKSAESQILDVAYEYTNQTAPPSVKFEDVFVCLPDKPNKGYKSWDEFFTKQFQPGKRPVGGPKPIWLDSDRVVLSACESAPLAIDTNVSLEDRFWLKGQPYSIENILDFDKRAKQFEGGTVYQAFLSGLSYHRWHSPVSGTIVKTKVVSGSYYLENIKFGLGNPNPDPSAPNDSQKFLSAVASRGLIFIEADGPIGLMCFVAVGMSEVSSCDITVKAGQRVEKGDEIGMFHYGGSSHCLLFRDNVNLDFCKIECNYNTGSFGVNSTNVPVKAQLARVMDDSPALTDL